MIRQFLDLSTGHLTYETRSLLSDGRLPLSTVYPTEFGWFVHVPDIDALGEVDQERQRDLPKDMKDVLDFARENGCDYVMFDSDAAPLMNLPYYEGDGEPV